mmetsp:Transcript_105133/g.314063  ORF Transcript_105133/g.314063 Transcript_105133/m.314063 type:complete len:242 (+) Transcript_105133:624-1349(+)
MSWSAALLLQRRSERMLTAPASCATALASGCNARFLRSPTAGSCRSSRVDIITSTVDSTARSSTAWARLSSWTTSCRTRAASALTSGSLKRRDRSSRGRSAPKMASIRGASPVRFQMTSKATGGKLGTGESRVASSASALSAPWARAWRAHEEECLVSLRSILSAAACSGAALERRNATRTGKACAAVKAPVRSTQSLQPSRQPSTNRLSPSRAGPFTWQSSKRRSREKSAPTMPLFINDA